MEAAIVALLSSPTIPEAAKAAGISESSLLRWMERGDFQRKYRAARREVIECAIASLQSAAGEAVETLRRNLRCGKPSVEVRAAATILEISIRGIELIDLEERISDLEETMMVKGEGYGKKSA